MLERIMFWVILGHFVGDYLMQTKKTALGKSAPGFRGMLTCAWHCLLYTWAVSLAVVISQNSWGTPSNAWIWPMVFLSHYPIDRWSLGDKWLKLIKGRRHTDGAFEPEYKPDTQWAIAALAGTQAFAAIVYVVVDNLMHVLLMTAGFAALLRWGLI